MPSHYPQYSYSEPSKPRNWPGIILGALGILLLIVIIWFFVINPLFEVKSGAENFINETIGGQDQQPQFVCNEDFYNCDDFDTQAEAQEVFDYCLGQGAGDVHQLDRDNNGGACEGLP